MKRHMRMLLSLFCVMSMLFGNTIKASKVAYLDTAEKTGKVHTYTNMIHYKGDILYLKEYDDGSESICRFLSSTTNSKVILTEKHGITNMVLSNDILYYTTIDAKARFVTYSISLSGKNKKKVVTGTVVYANKNDIVYLIESSDRLITYKKDLNTKAVKKIFETRAYMDYIKTIGDTLYFYKYESSSNRIKLYSYKTNESQMTLVTHDKCSKEEASYVYVISDVIKKDGVLYYQYGTIQGTGRYWYGNVKKIDTKGKKTFIMKSMEQEELISSNGSLYLTEADKHYVYNMKTGKKTSYSITLKDKQSATILGSRTYLLDVSNAKTITVSRFLSGTDKQSLHKSFIKIPFSQKQKFSYSGEIRKIGSSYVIGITTRDFSDNSYGWRGKEVAVNWFVADKNGKVIGKFC